MILYATVAFTIFMLGWYVLARIIRVRSGDTECVYALRAVRDNMIRGALFNDLDDQDPWYTYLSWGVENMLTLSHVTCGPKNWPVAVQIGRAYADEHPNGDPEAPNPPSTEMPESFSNVATQFVVALHLIGEKHLGMHFIGVAIKNRRNQIHKAEERRDRAIKQAEAIESAMHSRSCLNFA